MDDDNFDDAEVFEDADVDPEFEQTLNDFDEDTPAQPAPAEADEAEPDAEDEAEEELATEIVRELKLEPAEAPTQLPRILIRTPADRIFSDRITKYEYPRVLAVRATAIQNGDEHFAPAESIVGVTDVGQIALAEYRAGRCPLLILRPRRAATSTQGAIFEVWGVNELSGLGGD